MYPDNALGEFYPPWLIEEADKRCKSLKDIHAFCSPIMQAMGGGIDRGRDWCVFH